MDLGLGGESWVSPGAGPSSRRQSTREFVAVLPPATLLGVRCPSAAGSEAPTNWEACGHDTVRKFPSNSIDNALSVNPKSTAGWRAAQYGTEDDVWGGVFGDGRLPEENGLWSVEV